MTRAATAPTNPRRIAVAMAALALLTTTPLAAQDLPRSADVIPPGGQAPSDTPAEGASIQQLGPARRTIAPPAQIAPAQATARMPQLNATRRDAAPAVQLNAARRDARASAQLTAAEPTAEAATPLSHPVQGRRQALVRLGGRDRCDPQAAEGDAARCDTVIETRSGEFVRPDPLVLSPEQRLLVEQRLREGPSGPQSTVQRIGRNDIDPNAADDQGIASLTLPMPAPDAAPGLPGAPGDLTAEPSTAELIQAIIQGAGQIAPQP